MDSFKGGAARAAGRRRDGGHEAVVAGKSPEDYPATGLAGGPLWRSASTSTTNRYLPYLGTAADSAGLERLNRGRGAPGVHAPATNTEILWVEVIARYSKIPPPLKIRPSGGRRRSPTSPNRIHDVRRRLGPDTIAQLVADYSSGQRVAALMQTYGLGKGTVLSLLEEHGVQLRNPGVPPDQLNGLIRHYRSGLSLAKVAANFGCSAETARQALVAAGVRLRAPWERGPV